MHSTSTLLVCATRYCVNGFTLDRELGESCSGSRRSTRRPSGPIRCSTRARWRASERQAAAALRVRAAGVRPRAGGRRGVDGHAEDSRYPGDEDPPAVPAGDRQRGGCGGVRALFERAKAGYGEVSPMWVRASACTTERSSAAIFRTVPRPNFSRASRAPAARSPALSGGTTARKCWPSAETL